MKRKRLSKEARKKQIQAAARQVFLSKGISHTTMQDIVEATGLSVGGLYHYYRNPIEILKDIMLAGNDYRIQFVQEHYDQDNSLADNLKKAMADKIIHDHDNSKLYALLLAETIQKKQDYRDLFEYLEEVGLGDMSQIQSDLGLDPVFEFDDFQLAMLNTLIVGYHLLDYRDLFKEYRARIEAIVDLIVDSQPKEGGES